MSTTSFTFDNADITWPLWGSDICFNWILTLCCLQEVWLLCDSYDWQYDKIKPCLTLVVALEHVFSILNAPLVFSDICAFPLDLLLPTRSLNTLETPQDSLRSVWYSSSAAALAVCTASSRWQSVIFLLFPHAVLLLFITHTLSASARLDQLPAAICVNKCLPLASVTFQRPEGDGEGPVELWSWMRFAPMPFDRNGLCSMRMQGAGND